MNYKTLLIFFTSFLLSLWFVGCERRMATADKAIEWSLVFQSNEAKVRYLVKEARYFANNEQFEQAGDIAYYIVTRLDRDSKEAREILSKAGQSSMDSSL